MPKNKVIGGTPITDTDPLQVQTMSAALPSGAATAARQDTGNTSLASVDTKIGEVQASPTANTLLDRLKALLTGIVLAAGANIIGKVGIDQTTPGTTDKVTVGAGAAVPGLSTYFTNTVGATATAIKGSAGNLYTIEASNPNTSDAFLQLFDLAPGSVTLGVTAPKQSLLIPAGAGASNRGAADKVLTVPMEFDTQIVFAITTTPTGSTSPGTVCTLNVGYK
jgi:hypothetical protein